MININLDLLLERNTDYMHGGIVHVHLFFVLFVGTRLRNASLYVQAMRTLIAHLTFNTLQTMPSPRSLLLLVALDDLLENSLLPRSTRSVPVDSPSNFVSVAATLLKLDPP